MTKRRREKVEKGFFHHRILATITAREGVLHPPLLSVNALYPSSTFETPALLIDCKYSARDKLSQATNEDDECWTRGANPSVGD